MFSDVLAPRPHSMSFYIKNTHMKLYGFFDELSWWSSSPRPQSTSNLQKIMDWIIFALALGADGPCAQVNSFRWHWLGSGGTHEKTTVPHCEVLVHSVPYFSITFITLFKSFSKSFWKFKNLKMKMYFHFLFKFCWFRKCSKMVLKNVCSTFFLRKTFFNVGFLIEKIQHFFDLISIFPTNFNWHWLGSGGTQKMFFYVVKKFIWFRL